MILREIFTINSGGHQGRLIGTFEILPWEVELPDEELKKKIIGASIVTDAGDKDKSRHFIAKGILMGARGIFGKDKGLVSILVEEIKDK